MTYEVLDISGMTFTYLTVIERLGSKSGKALWKCLCKCGKYKEVVSANLLSDRVKSCGCYARRNKISCVCKACNREFLIKASHIDTEGTYCSRFCMSEGYKIYQNGKDNPNYKHGLAYTAEYRKPYRDKWLSENPEKIAEFNRNMKAKRKGAIGIHTWQDIAQKLHDQWGLCYWCHEALSQTYEIDHVIPLSRSGTNCKNNIVVSCKLCNRQKRNLFVTEWSKLDNCRNKRTNCIIGMSSHAYN